MNKTRLSLYLIHLRVTKSYAFATPFFYYFLITVNSLNIPNTAALTQTTQAPVGIPNTTDKIIPKAKHIIEKTPDIITVDLKFRQTVIAVADGKIIRLEIRSVPIILMPSTTVIAVSTATAELKKLVLTPDDFEKVSSNVTAKILGYKRIKLIMTMQERRMLKTASESLTDSMLPNI